MFLPTTISRRIFRWLLCGLLAALAANTSAINRSRPTAVFTTRLSKIEDLLSRCRHPDVGLPGREPDTVPLLEPELWESPGGVRV